MSDLQQFKTVSYPRSASGTGKAELLRLAFGVKRDAALYGEVKDLSSAEMRILLNNLSVADLKDTSERERRSLNNHCLLLLSQKIEGLKRSQGDGFDLKRAFSKYFIYSNFTKLSGTFRENDAQRVHRWYPYVEGYSCTFVDEILDRLPYQPSAVFDPFSGTGTTQIVASHRGIPSWYADVNPLMRFLLDTKVNVVARLLPRWDKARRGLDTLAERAGAAGKKKTPHGTHADLLPFFGPSALSALLRLKAQAEDALRDDPDALSIARAALAGITVSASRMIRRADLRYRRPEEAGLRPEEIAPAYAEKLRQMIADITALRDDGVQPSPTILWCENAKAPPPDARETFDLIITSPPYLNGTNYFRNTKLELRLLDLAPSLDALKEYRAQAVTAGINNVSAALPAPRDLPFLRPTLDALEKAAYDPRIPRMAEAYFSDMDRVFEVIAPRLAPHAHFYLDIGDSQFAGVRIPVDDYLAECAERHGLVLKDRTHLRERSSKNGMPLRQTLLLLMPEKTRRKTVQAAAPVGGAAALLERNLETFLQFPYKRQPYAKRNWGHPWHSLCSYQGKLKPSIAHDLVRLFTAPGMRVLDPLAGIGTIPFEACLQGREGIANDLSALAFSGCDAKVHAQDAARIETILQDLERHVAAYKPSTAEKTAADFGFNGTLAEYYHPRTFRELLAARAFFRDLPPSPEASLLRCCLLHILHGNRPYALSRRSHPVVPFAPKGPAVYKSVPGKLREKVSRALAEPRPAPFRTGQSIRGDYRALLDVIPEASIDAILTSPPFLDSTRFSQNNWIRLWFTGWEEADFVTERERFLETRQKKNIGVYDDFFALCALLLKDDGIAVLHLGKTAKKDMGALLVPFAEKHLRIVELADEGVGHVEKFGIEDQGGTSVHQFLFLRK